MDIRVRMMKFTALALLLLFGAGSVAARRVKTRRASDSPKVVISEETSPGFDTIAGVLADRTVTISGYDKPLRASRESMFMTSNDSSAIMSLSFSIGYYDMQGRMIHKARHRLNVDIPPFETRQLTFPSWDRQQSFYYRRSTPPKRVSATPYEVKISVDTLFIVQP